MHPQDSGDVEVAKSNSGSSERSSVFGKLLEGQAWDMFGKIFEQVFTKIRECLYRYADINSIEPGMLFLA